MEAVHAGNQYSLWLGKEASYSENTIDVNDALKKLTSWLEKESACLENNEDVSEDLKTLYRN